MFFGGECGCPTIFFTPVLGPPCFVRPTWVFGWTGWFKPYYPTNTTSPSIRRHYYLYRWEK